MREITATEAARSFSEVLDAVEHDHETLVVTRGGKTVALMGLPSMAEAFSGERFVRLSFED